MKEINIDLGESYPHPPHLTPMSVESEDHVHYPELHVVTDEMLDIPREGKMIVHYRKKGYRELDNGKYSCDICIKKIVAVETVKAPPSQRDRSAEEALDALAEKMAEEKHRKMMEKQDDDVYGR